MAYTKKAINEKYDKLRAQLKAGTIDQKKFKASANRLYELYHSDANKATRNKVGPAKPVKSAKPAPTSTPKPKAGGKTGKAVLELGGSNVKKVTSKPKVATTKKDMPYQGVFPGTPEQPKPKKKESNSERNRRGRGAGTRNRSAKNTPAEGATKTIQVGPKRVTMVYKGGKWVRKNGK